MMYLLTMIGIVPMVNTRKSHLLFFLFLITGITARGVTDSQPNLVLPKTEFSTKKSRMRKTHAPHKKVKEKEKKIYTYKDMDYDQLLVAKDTQLAAGNRSSVIKYLEQLVQ